MRVLIITPSFSIVGGVANHYLGLKNYWSEDVRYEFYGKRKKIPAIITLGWDLLKYTVKLIFQRPDLVVVNPSLRKYQLFRDGVYLRIARVFGIQVVAFLHGWDQDYAKVLINDGKQFKKIYDKASTILVLAEEFSDDLRKIGITTKIELTTTKVNNELLEDFDINSRTGEVREILFLARIVEQKGIFIVIEAMRQLQETHPEIALRIVGSGPDLERVKLFAKEIGVKNLIFRGPIFGKEIKEEFKATQVYILPSTHGEGMPTSVLEAMAFGMPVLSRPLGGLNDFFETPDMGTLVDNLEPESYTTILREWINNQEYCMDTARKNHLYAKEHFLASAVAKQLESVFREVVKK